MDAGIELCWKLLEERRALWGADAVGDEADDFRSYIRGGPDADARALREQGVAEIFGPGSSLKAIAQWLETALDARED
jgi:hypothetical protein